MSQQIKVIERNNAVVFAEEVNFHLADGYIVSSTSCGFVNSDRYDFCHNYQAILILEDPINTTNKILTSPKTAEKDFIELVSETEVRLDRFISSIEKTINAMKGKKSNA